MMNYQKLIQQGDVGRDQTKQYSNATLNKCRLTTYEQAIGKRYKLTKDDENKFFKKMFG